MPAVRIFVAGAEVTDDVLFESASFDQKVNGQAGDAYMRVRDPSLSSSFPIGSDWLVTVDGAAVWRGFVTQAIRTFVMDVVDLGVPGTQRFWDVRGADGNLLFDRRVVFDGSSPLTQGVAFPANTPDTTAITSLLGWLDLTADMIDTTSGVTHVAELDPEAAYEGWAGWKWQAAMDSIRLIPAAIYYLRPEAGSSPRYTLVYCDADTATAPFGLSDQPDGVTTMGYREFEVALDATAMANDVLAYGYGYGSQVPVHTRLASSASVAAHGLWQFGSLNPGVYRQATLDRIADSIVNGSPAHHRGAKDDRPQVSCTTYAPGLLAGHVVAFACNQYGYSDSLPVRQLAITFKAPGDPRWDLVLSHEIDAPWQSTDPYAIPSVGLPPIPGVPIPGGGGLPPGPPVCDCVDPATGHDRCADVQFDDFNRTVGPGGWGTATPGGFTWTIASEPVEVVHSVNGSAGLVAITTSGTTTGTISAPAGASPALLADTFTMRTVFKFSDVPDASHPTYPHPDLLISIQPYASGYGGHFNLAAVEVTVNASHSFPYSSLGNLLTRIDVNPAFWIANEWYTLEAVVVAGVLTTNLYAPGATSPTYSVGGGTLPAGRDGSLSVVVTKAGWPDLITTSIDSIDFDYAGRPCYLDCGGTVLDDFTRSVGSGWGTADPSGYAWVEYKPGALLWSSSNVGSGTGNLVVATNTTGGTNVIYERVDAVGGDPWLAAGAVMTARISLSALPPSDPILSTSFTFGFGAGAPPIFGPLIGSVSIDEAGVLYIRAGSGSYVSVGTATAGVVYNVKYDLSSFQGKIWEDGTTEPGWQAVSSGTLPGGASLYLSASYFGHQLVSSDAITISYDSIAFGVGDCVPVDPAASGTPTSPTGYGCEVPARTSSTVYTTSAAFAPGSVLVWRAGLLQRPGTDFTEGADQVTITFTTAVAVGEEVRACYLAAVRS